MYENDNVSDKFSFLFRSKFFWADLRFYLGPVWSFSCLYFFYRLFFFLAMLQHSHISAIKSE